MSFLAAVRQRGRLWAYLAYLNAWFTVTSRYPIGTNVYNLDWDVLILLDTCRVDALRAVADEYDFVEQVDSILSVGSTSSEWVANTFRDSRRAEISETAYISGNAYAKRVIQDRQFPLEGWLMDWSVVQPDAFQVLDHAWQHQADNEYKHALPEDVTDRAIVMARRYDPERLVVHYLQPHKPYIAGAMREDRDLYDYERNPFEALRNGDATYEQVWMSYLDNLRLVLDNVKQLLENVDGETAVLSSDHGESFGEYGGLVYGHPRGVLHPHVKRVPWAETTARDTGEYTPDIDVEAADEETAVTDELRDLGYL